MKHAKLLHNPEAGDGKHSKRELLRQLKDEGLDCSYSSTKRKGWDKIDVAENDLLIIAGGDGTIRNVAEELLEKNHPAKKLPIGLYPLGTSNNIAYSLGVSKDQKDIMKVLRAQDITFFDVGVIEGLKKHRYFLEAIGFGIFPHLMAEMDNEDDPESPEEKLKMALEKFGRITKDYEGDHCEITIDNEPYEGKFLMVEIMNTASIGPKLKLAPLANPGDGEFDVVLVREENRNDLLDYILNLQRGKRKFPLLESKRAGKIEISCAQRLLHVDDEYKEIKKSTKIKISMERGALKFFSA